MKLWNWATFKLLPIGVLQFCACNFLRLILVSVRSFQWENWKLVYTTILKCICAEIRSIDPTTCDGVARQQKCKWNKCSQNQWCQCCALPAHLALWRPYFWSYFYAGAIFLPLKYVLIRNQLGALADFVCLWVVMKIFVQHRAKSYKGLTVR